jgi:hypothetical protein
LHLHAENWPHLWIGLKSKFRLLEPTFETRLASPIEAQQVKAAAASFLPSSASSNGELGCQQIIFREQGAYPYQILACFVLSAPTSYFCRPAPALGLKRAGDQWEATHRHANDQWGALTPVDPGPAPVALKIHRRADLRIHGRQPSLDARSPYQLGPRWTNSELSF